MNGFAALGEPALGEMEPGVTSAIELPTFDALEAEAAQLVWYVEFEVATLESVA